MTVFRRAVVGFDGSAPAHDALALAQRLIDHAEGELLLACVDAGRGFRLPHGRARHDDGDVLAAGLAEVAEGVRSTGIARTAASAARGLMELAEEQRADLLVLGAHHGTAEERTTPGPTALRLLQGAPCAVAVAPLGLRERDRFRHVGIAYDGSPEADAALTAAYALAARDGAAVSIFEALAAPGLSYAGEPDPRADAQQSLDAAADAAPAGVNPRTVLLHGDPAERDRPCGGGHRRRPVLRLPRLRPAASRARRQRVPGAAARRATAARRAPPRQRRPGLAVLTGDDRPRRPGYRACSVPTGARGAGAWTRTRISTIVAPSGATTTGLQSSSAIAGWSSASALMRRRTSSSAATSARGAPRRPSSSGNVLSARGISCTSRSDSGASRIAASARSSAAVPPAAHRHDRAEAWIARHAYEQLDAGRATGPHAARFRERQAVAPRELRDGAWVEPLRSGGERAGEHRRGLVTARWGLRRDGRRRRPRPGRAVPRGRGERPGGVLGEADDRDPGRAQARGRRVPGQEHRDGRAA